MRFESKCNSKTVLLVDDEGIVLRAGKRMLDKIGVPVLLAKSGEEAIQVYRENWQSISMVLLDIVLPKMSGKKTLEQMLHVNPKAKIMVSSGYNKDESVEALIKDGATDFVPKPYGFKELSDIVKRVIV